MLDARPLEAVVETAHEVLWRRFVDGDGIVLDYVGPTGEVLRPTPEECRQCRPNALSWGVPNENGAFFGGLYLGAMLSRCALTGREEDRQRARELAAGLRLLASVGEQPGFIARGVAADGRSHFPIGSNDQTTPWLHGMWRYLRSDVPEADEREAVWGEFIEVAEVLAASGWRTPCDRPPFDFRNCLANEDFESAPRLLWLCRVMHELTGEERWAAEYEQALVGGARLDICRRGMVWEHGYRSSWTAANSVAALRGLWELESGRGRREAYAQGLRHSALLAAESLPLAQQFDHDDPRPYSGDWRALNELWQEQHSVAEAVALAERQLRRLAEVSPRWPYEANLMREPLFAAWIVALCPEGEVVAPRVPEIEAALRHYRFDHLHLSQFFAAELAYYQLREGRLL